MLWRQPIRILFLCFFWVALLALVRPAAAQTMLSVQGSVLNMRAGPSTDKEILWELKRGYPLQLVQRQGRWLKVKDFEGDQGWVAASLTGKTPHHVVKSRWANLRKGPGTQHPVLGKLAYGDLLKTQATQGDWVKVKPSSGPIGWVSKALLWGW